MDREEAGMFDLFLKNILNVAESKFSTAKHLHDVWRGIKIAIRWLDRTNFMPTCLPYKKRKKRLHERMVSIIRL